MEELFQLHWKNSISTAAALGTHHFLWQSIWTLVKRGWRGMMGARGLSLFSANRAGHSSYKTFIRIHLSIKNHKSLPAFVRGASSAGNEISSLPYPAQQTHSCTYFAYKQHTHTRAYTYIHTLPLLNSQFSSQTSTLYKSFLWYSKKEFANETVQKFSLTVKLKMTWTQTTKRYSWIVNRKTFILHFALQQKRKPHVLSNSLPSMINVFFLKPLREGEVHISWTFQEAEIIPVLSASDLHSTPKRHRAQQEKC